jgi:hypothetical protein
MTIPRKHRLDLMIPAELAIMRAKSVVEETGCHVLLTEALNLLSEAQDKVAEYWDSMLIPVRKG